MAVEHTVLITAAGGNIGSELVPQLLAAKHKLVLPTSNAPRLQSRLPSTANSTNIACEEGDIKDPAWLESILTKHMVDTVFLCLTGADELLTSLNFFDAMLRSGGVKHLVYLSACADFVSEEGVRNTMKYCSAAHVIVKTTIEQKLLYADFPWATTRIGPTLFVSNDLRSKHRMLERGMFDEPLGEKGVSRVDPSDIALAVTNIIADPAKWDGKKVVVGSRKLFTASEVAELWSKALDRKISPTHNDKDSLEEFGKIFHEKTGRDVAWARDLKLMYETFSRQAFGPTEEQYQEQIELLGKEPGDDPSWVAKVGAKWRQEMQ